MKMTRQNHRVPNRAQALKLSAATLLLALGAAHSLPAATVTLQKGLYGDAGAADAWLDESAQTDNYGGSQSLQIKYNGGMSDCTLVPIALPSLGFQGLISATLGLSSPA
jgi:hypothetical protein